MSVLSVSSASGCILFSQRLSPALCWLCQSLNLALFSSSNPNRGRAQGGRGVGGFIDLASKSIIAVESRDREV